MELPKFSLERFGVVWWLQLVAAVAHTVSFIAMPLFMRKVEKLPFYIITTYFNSTLSGFASETYTLTRTNSIEAYGLLMFFFGASMIEHTWCLLCWTQYTTWVKEKKTYFRWISYGISAPVMVVVIAYQSAIRDVFALYYVAGLTAVVIATGALHDYLKRESMMPLVAGFLLLLFFYMPIFAQYGRFASEAPSFVTAIVIVLFLLYLSFGFVTLLSFWYKEESPYAKSELAFVILSLSSKLILGWVDSASLVARYD